MSELLKGLIGAELTLLGVVGQLPPQKEVADSGAAAHGNNGENNKDDERPNVAFTQHDYRTAAG